ncbi:MAG: hypothetical protein GF409_05875 [Candidatus Omnitrophica bacterium]|nr:hypothetical protein [Candidatus Omnitrophota bacterium]
MFILLTPGICSAQEEIRFDFEQSQEGWKIPDWAFYQGDHVAISTEVTAEEASSGENSLQVDCEFPGNRWAAALVEFKVEKGLPFLGLEGYEEIKKLEYLDLTGYKNISVDVYLPRKAPAGLIQARIILTVGEGWLFTEMRYAVPLERGKWTTIQAKLDTPEDESSEWKGRKEKKLIHHQDKVRKIAIRIEYDAAPPHRIGRKYHGPIYIDNLLIN